MKAVADHRSLRIVGEIAPTARLYMAFRRQEIEREFIFPERPRRLVTFAECAHCERVRDVQLAACPSCLSTETIVQMKKARG